jgi:Flp pilus assembly pilin Flp
MGIVTHMRSRKGQAAVEYALTAGMLIIAITVLAVFLYAFKEHGGRVLDLAASEYP